MQTGLLRRTAKRDFKRIRLIIFSFINLAEYMGGKKKEWLKLAKELNPHLKPAKFITGVYEGIKMAEYMDEMEALYYQNAGYEAEKGSYRKVMDPSFTWICRSQKPKKRSKTAIRRENQQ